jgi:hypothetical protein
MQNQESIQLKPTSKLIVKYGKEGVLLHGRPDAPIKTLRIHELMALTELEGGVFMETTDVAAVVAARTGVQESEVEAFLRMLIRSGRLRRRREALRRMTLPQSSLPASPETSSVGTGVIALKLPLVLRLCDSRFQLIDHNGRLIVALTAAEVIAVGQFVQPLSFADGLQKQREALKENAIGETPLRWLLSKLHSAGLMSMLEPQEAAHKEVHFKQIMKVNFARQSAEHDKAEAEREQRTGQVRSKVIPVSFGDYVPAGMGLVFAYAKAYNGGILDEFYDIRLDWFWDEDRIAKYTANPAIYLFSNYLWTHERSIAVSEMLKRLSPDSVTIHGGPDTPKYEGDARAYLTRFPHVDIIVRGEGEASAADTLDKLRAIIGQKNPDLSVLRDVAGVTYRYGDEIFHNPDRARIEDLDTIPSPYLTGLFEGFRGVPDLYATLETNRGCPYGCTFCDWGSATLSKIRKFDLNRVFDELAWCSEFKLQMVGQADANFGVFERDVEVAQRVADLKKATGYPAGFGGSYAKNSTKYLKKIIKVMADAGIMTQGILSLQTMDDTTLSAVKRSNIRVDKYDALADEMRKSELTLTVELMMGLPGSTVKSFLEDLQQCIDRDIPARINLTTLLVNSPMNSPDYRAAHQIETMSEVAPGKMPLLVSTNSYTREDFDTMDAMRQIYMFLDNFGVMRLCARFVHQQAGLTEMEFYKQLWQKTGGYEQQWKWPLLHTLVNHGHDLMAPPYSWALVYAELREFLIKECGVPDDSALDTILAAQHALLPAYDRSYPLVIELPHDVVAWHAQMLETKAAGLKRDWHTVLPPLLSFAPGRLVVNDVGGAVTKLLGCPIDVSAFGTNWDMESGLERARPSSDQSVSMLQKDEIIRVA